MGTMSGCAWCALSPDPQCSPCALESGTGLLAMPAPVGAVPQGRPRLVVAGYPTIRTVVVERDSRGAWSCYFGGGRYADAWTGNGLLFIGAEGAMYCDEDHDTPDPTVFQLPFPDSWAVAVESWKEGCRVVAVDLGGE